MPQRNRTLFKLVFLPLGLIAMLFAIVRRRPDDWEYEPADVPASEAVAPPAEPVAARRPARRIALAGAFTVLFFAGASFTAGAGDQMVKLMEEDAAALEAARAEAAQSEPLPSETAVAGAEQATAATPGSAPGDIPAGEIAAAESSPVETAPTEAIASEAAAPETIEPEAAPSEAAPADAPAAEAASATEPAPSSEAGGSAASNVTARASAQAAKAPARAAAAAPAPAPAGRAKQWVVKRAEETPAEAPEIEHEGHGQATVWLNRALPDPTPASARLTRPFARQLRAAAKRHGADWATVLAILRAQGDRGSTPATAAQLDTLARRLARTNAWKGALALSGRTGFADRTAALADLYRFVGIETLVSGYANAKERLAKKILATEAVFIYAGGREDIERGRIDVRILVLIGYLAERHGGVTVSSLFSGHRMFSRPGVISAHMYGHATDIAAVGGTAIFGNQQPGGVTEAAIRSVLLLPSELQPRQVISLLGLGGPSFPLRDHGDHIHVGY